MFKVPGRSFMFFASALRSWLDELRLLEVLCGSLEVLGLLLITFLIDSLEVFNILSRQDLPRLPWSTKRYPVPCKLCLIKAVKRNNIEGE